MKKFLIVLLVMLIAMAAALIYSELSSPPPPPPPDPPPCFDEELLAAYRDAEKKGDYIAMKTAYDENMKKTGVSFFEDYDPSYGGMFFAYPYSVEVDGEETAGMLYVFGEGADKAAQSLTENDFYALDRRMASDPEIVVYDSFRADSQILIRCLCQILLEHEKAHPSRWERTLDSLTEEWEIHNAAYVMGYKTDHAKDVNLNNADENTDWIERASKELSQ